MAFSEGAVNVHRVIQKVFTLPYYIVIDNNLTMSLIATYKPFDASNSSKLIWKAAKYTMALITVFCILRLEWLFSNWKDNPDLRQLGVYIGAICILTIGLAAYQSLETFKEDWSYLMTQRFRICRMDPNILKRHSIRRLKIGEGLLYLLLFGFLFFPPMVANITRMRDNDPIQIMLRTLLGKFVPIWGIKVTTSILYAGIVSHGTATVLTLILLAVTFVDAARMVSAQLSILPIWQQCLTQMVSISKLRGYDDFVLKLEERI
ncbi:unnamed protein product [Orchesella dallaii]|uniref:Gustatory receptor n=1 Tax=Orchesella dallaii TaxID=48710 RepID=A0ABP1RJL1_9HEXA